MITEFMRDTLARSLAKNELRHLSRRQEGPILCS
jgi:hypothetical protein